ncbi:uncharacterized protein LOC127661241 [Xyrauchen texanus]|uniref:uncharacterized protein LOC127661241 n=1 Tax=Xyrauchen texanus TaxID=154827 RepID=UPI0022420C6A|nr:uncharacterized protein LOC127661241 [Xyrauchen texanus]XP_052007826.1 uncharacterized protein LOC127661241 [Xyrauchen texanus]
MGAKLSRKKSENGKGAEATGLETAEQKPSEVSVSESASEESNPSEQAPNEDQNLSEPASSTSFLESITQAVGEMVSAVNDQIATPEEDVVSKGIEAVESALAAASLNVKEPSAPIQEPENIQEPEPLVAPSLLNDMLKSQPFSEAVIAELDSGVTVETEAITSLALEEKMTNPAQTENKDLVECLENVATPSVDLVDGKVTHDFTTINSEPSISLDDMGQGPAVDTVNPV